MTDEGWAFTNTAVRKNKAAVIILYMKIELFYRKQICQKNIGKEPMWLFRQQFFDLMVHINNDPLCILSRKKLEI